MHFVLALSVLMDSLQVSSFQVLLNYSMNRRWRCVNLFSVEIKSEQPLFQNEQAFRLSEQNWSKVS